jgi:hypothetical protein
MRAPPNQEPTRRSLTPSNGSTVMIIVIATHGIDQLVQLTPQTVPFGQHLMPLLVRRHIPMLTCCFAWHSKAGDNQPRMSRLAAIGSQRWSMIVLIRC